MWKRYFPLTEYDTPICAMHTDSYKHAHTIDKIHSISFRHSTLINTVLFHSYERILAGINIHFIFIIKIVILIIIIIFTERDGERFLTLRHLAWADLAPISPFYGLLDSLSLIHTTFFSLGLLLQHFLEQDSVFLSLVVLAPMCVECHLHVLAVRNNNKEIEWFAGTTVHVTRISCATAAKLVRSQRLFTSLEQNDAML